MLRWRQLELHALSRSPPVTVQYAALFDEKHNFTSHPAAALAATRTVNVDWFTIASFTSVRIFFSCAHHPESIIMEVVVNVHALHLECI